MPIIFNDYTDCQVVKRTTGGGITWSAHLNGSAAFDYFADTPAINDAIYFVRYVLDTYDGVGKWRNLRINVNTPRTNAGTGGWEYWNGAAWVSLTVTDPSNGFTVAGSHTVSFTPPANWTRSTDSNIGGNRFFPIRYRLTNVTGITEGGANGTSKAQGGSNSYHVVGYSAVTPCTFDDLKTFDSSQGNNLITQVGKLFSLNCGLVIGDGSTDSFFVAENRLIQIGGQLAILGKGNFRSGVESNYACYSGCSVMIRDENAVMYSSMFNQTNAVIEIYNSKINSSGSVLIGKAYNTCKIKNTQFSDTNLQLAEAIYSDVSISNCNDAFRVMEHIVTQSDNVKIQKSTGSAVKFFYNYAMSNKIYRISNLTIVDCTSHVSISSPNASESNFKLQLIDCIGLDMTKITKIAGTTYTNSYVEEIYTVNYMITDKDGLPIPNTTVKYTNDFGTFETTSSPTLGLVYLEIPVKRYNLATGALEISSSCTETISKPGYETIINKVALYTKVSDIVNLRHSPFASVDEMGALHT